MLWISHRGNVHGPEPERENHPSYINLALEEGFDVEVDVWDVNGNLYLGHDEPICLLPSDYLLNNRFWFHAKNVEALMFLKKLHRVKYFWHQTDDYTLTSNGKIWTYPGKKLVDGAVAVVPEVAYDGDLWNCHAICTDYIYRYKGLYESRNTN